MASESSATRNRRKGRITRAIHAAGSAALAAALVVTLQLGTAGAQAPGADESSAQSTEQSANDSTEQSANDSTEQSANDSTEESARDSTEESANDSTEESARDSTEVAPTTARSIPVKRPKKASKPFKPTKRIEAESVISFPANI